MNPKPSSPSLARTLPAGQTQTSYSSVFVQVGLFVFNPTLVMAFVHRPGTDQTTPQTEVFYDSHHLSVEDPNQALFFYLRRHTHPQEIPTAL